jgi:hypothetical protein
MRLRDLVFRITTGMLWTGLSDREQHPATGERDAAVNCMPPLGAAPRAAGYFVTQEHGDGRQNQ